MYYVQRERAATRSAHFGFASSLSILESLVLAQLARGENLVRYIVMRGASTREPSTGVLGDDSFGRGVSASTLASGFGGSLASGKGIGFGRQASDGKSVLVFRLFAFVVVVALV